MWPFTSSNVAIVNEKREQRTQSLADVKKDAPEHQVYLKATGQRFSSFWPALYCCGPILTIHVASEIVVRIQNGEWTATEVLEAYISRAAYAQEKTNCLTEGKRLSCRVLGARVLSVIEVMLGPARQRAKELDAEFAITKRVKGPLHGVPVRSWNSLTSLYGVLIHRHHRWASKSNVS